MQLALPATGTDLDALVARALALGARDVAGWSSAETALAAGAPPADPATLQRARAAIERGEDALGDAFASIFSSEQRRPLGAIYTPLPIVRAMHDWAQEQGSIARVIDPGVGSARYLVEAGRRFPEADLLGIDVDPRAALLARGHLAAAGMAARASVLVGDFREPLVPPIAGRTLFVGNPPYVRHHLIERAWKTWLVERARAFGLTASQLAGLHVHFFLAVAQHAHPGDIGTLITAAEWLDVNYGRLARELLLGPLGIESFDLIEPAAEPFPGTQTTAVVTRFTVGAAPSHVSVRRIHRVEEFAALAGRELLPRERLANAMRWTPLTRAATGRRDGFVELVELCRVHRGAVTGANKVWIENGVGLPLPESVLFPAVTRAKELFDSAGRLDDPSRLRRVIDLPVDLDTLPEHERSAIERFLAYARTRGADSGFIARHRKAWWAVGLREPAPILATYMARRPPIFVRNFVEARHINIAHGLYPRAPLTDTQLSALAWFLSSRVNIEDGRTYAGGLTKFEPREMERLLVPVPEHLVDHAPEAGRP